MNQYLDWIYCRIIFIKKVSVKTHEGGIACNSIILFFNNLPPIKFPKKLIKHKGINIKNISVGEILCIQPKVRGKILGAHMINDLELRKKRMKERRTFKIWRRSKIISTWNEIKFSFS